jgi:hypothetical protein
MNYSSSSIVIKQDVDFFNFMSEICSQIQQNEKSLVDCAIIAYDKGLKFKHSWIL